jgi:hypothetical protein
MTTTEEEILKQKYPKVFNIVLSLRGPEKATTEDVRDILRLTMPAADVVDVAEMDAGDGVLATKEQLETMIRVTGARDQLAQTMANYRVSLGRQLGLSEEELDGVFEGVNVEKLLAVAVSVYQKHFTAQEIKGVIGFYSSSVGQKFVQKIVPVNQEIYEACRKLLDLGD